MQLSRPLVVLKRKEIGVPCLGEPSQLAGMRTTFLPYFKLSVAVAFSIAACLCAHAQVNGVPPSVTSIGFGGRPLNGVPPSVTSLGFGGNYKNGWPMVGASPLASGSSFFDSLASVPAASNHHRHHKDHGAVLVGVPEPVYVPYAPQPDDDSVDADASIAPPLVPSAGNRNAAPPVSEVADEPVVAQPSTVLVFKDGHQSDVLNYAIVGDTLFDFEEGRTRKIQLTDLDLKATEKANDDRGVDFEIPAR
jgi:hypothetical protein